MIGGDSTGVWQNPLDPNEIFVSYGSGVLTAAGPTSLLNIPFTGFGTIEAEGLVAQAVPGVPPSAVFDGLTASLTVVPEPAGVLLAMAGAALVGFRRKL